jgi:hypothetical protein
MYDELLNIKKAFERLSESLNYSQEKKNELYNSIARPLEIFIKASRDPKSEEKNIIKRLIESIYFFILNIDESVVNKKDLYEDKIIILDSPLEILKKSNINAAYLSAIEKHISLSFNSPESGIRVEDAIRAHEEFKNNDLNKIDISQDWLIYHLSKFMQNENYLVFQFSELNWANFLLNLKVYFVKEFFSKLIDLYKITNNLGTDDTILLIKSQIKKYIEALSPAKQLFILSTFILDNKGFDICKRTSDEYSRVMLNIYQSKLSTLQGIKDDYRKVKEQIETPYHKNIDNINKAIDEHLGYLTTSIPKGEIIMTNEEYTRLKNYISLLVINEEVPFVEYSFQKLNVSDQTIIYSFYLLHKELFGTKPIKDFFIDFLLETFTQLQEYTASTLKTKFSVKPKRYPY